MNRNEWLKWRRGGIGSSDATIIMGLAPKSWHKSRYGLYLDKVFGDEENEQNPAMRRGTEMEPLVRAMLEEETGQVLEPRNVDNGELWRASLDAVSLDGKHVYEIKVPGEPAHALALKGEVPDYYIPQVQHQLLVTGLPSLTYVSYRDGICVKIEVERDEEYIEKLKAEEIAFWELVKNKTPPKKDKEDPIEKDYDALWKVISPKYIKAKQTLEEDELIHESLRKDMIQASGGATSKGCGVLVTRIVEDGRIDYKSAYLELKKAVEDAGGSVLDIESYRSTPLTKFRISTY